MTEFVSPAGLGLSLLHPTNFTALTVHSVEQDSGIDSQVHVLTQIDGTLSTVLEICRGPESMVLVRADGSVEYGLNYSPDEAARVFWEAIGRLDSVRKSFLKIEAQASVSGLLT